MLNAMQADAMQRAGQQFGQQVVPGGFGPPGTAANPAQGGFGPAGTAANPYEAGWQAEPQPMGPGQAGPGQVGPAQVGPGQAGPEQFRPGQGRRAGWDSGAGSGYYDPAQDFGSAAMGAAAGVIGRAIGKRLQKTYVDRIGTLQERMAQVMQQAQNAQVAIVERYPDLRGCMHDLVLFLPGGTATVPISEVKMPVTLARADALVARLRGA